MRSRAGRGSTSAASAAARRRAGPARPFPPPAAASACARRRTLACRGMAKKRERIRAPESEYRDEHGSVLVLRGALTPATRSAYAAELHGNVLSQEDAWQRAVEFLFERLAVRWEIAGTEPIARQK